MKRLNESNIWKRVSVFGSSMITKGSKEFIQCKELGKLLAENHFTILSGDPIGIGKAMAEGISKIKKGRIIFICTRAGILKGYSAYQKKGCRPFPVGEWGEKRWRLIDFSGYHIYFPGALGTFSELTTSIDKITHSLRLKRKPPMVILIGNFWKKTFEGVIRPLILDKRVFDYVVFVKNNREAISTIQHFMSKQQLKDI